MKDGIFLLILIQMWLESSRLDFEVVVKKCPKIAASVFGLRQNFHAVAGRENQPLIHAGMLHQSLDGIGKARLGDGEALAHLQRSRGVVHSDELKLHERTSL
jgi:hypothetical protein